MSNPLILLLTRPAKRKRSWYAVAMGAVIALGLASRRIPWLFPAAFGKYPGDVLWALMVFLGWAILFSRQSTLRIATYALSSSICIEFLKLYQSPGMDTIRNTIVGRLVFGYVFSWQNIVAYVVGIAGGALTECGLRGRPGV